MVLTMHAGDDQIFAAMEAGASAFVGKDSPSAEVVNAARHAAISPRSFLCAGLAEAVMRRTTSESTRLTTREHDVLMLLAEGLSAAEIGDPSPPQRVDGEVARGAICTRSWEPRTGPRPWSRRCGSGSYPAFRVSTSTTNLGKK